MASSQSLFDQPRSEQKAVSKLSIEEHNLLNEMLEKLTKDELEQYLALFNEKHEQLISQKLQQDVDQPSLSAQLEMIKSLDNEEKYQPDVFKKSLEILEHCFILLETSLPNAKEEQILNLKKDYELLQDHTGMVVKGINILAQGKDSKQQESLISKAKFYLHKLNILREQLGIKATYVMTDKLTKKPSNLFGKATEDQVIPKTSQPILGRIFGK